MLEYKYFTYFSSVALYCMHPVVYKPAKILISVRVICCLMYLWAVVGSLKINRRLVHLQLNILYWCLEKLRVFLLFSFHGPPRASPLSRLHDRTQTHHSPHESSGRVICSTQRPLPEHTRQSQQKDFQAAGGIRTHNPSNRAVVDLRIRPRGRWDRQILQILYLQLPALLHFFVSFTVRFLHLLL